MEDIFSVVAVYLDTYSLCSCMRVCSHFYKIMNKESIWHEKCIEYGYSISWIQTWREQFRVSHVLGNFITGYGLELNELVTLRALVLDFRKVDTLPVDLDKLINLRALSLYKAELDSLPSVIYDLTLLQDLDLRFNELQTLPEGIGKLINLRVLHLSSNRLQTLPVGIEKLINLKELWLRNNKLGSLFKGIGEFENTYFG